MPLSVRSRPDGAVLTRPSRSLRPTRPTRRDAPRAPRPRLALIAILVCQLMVVLDATIVNIALPDIQREVGFSATGLSWVLNAYALTFGGLLLLGSRCGDLFGRRGVFLAGIAVFTVASLAGGLTDSPGLLLAARSLQGIGAAFASPSALALLMVTFPGGAERTRAIALYTAVSIGGSGVGLILGGVLVQWLSWRWVFFVNVPIGVWLVLAAARALPDTGRTRGRIDVPGALTSTLGMAALVFGLVHAATAGWGAPVTVASFVVGVVLLAGFVAVERRVPTPITPLRLFADRNRSASYVARLLLVAGMMGMFFFLTQFLQDVLGYRPLATGLAFLPLTAALFLASQFSARVLLARFPARWVMVVGVSLSTLGVLQLTQVHAGTGYLQVLAALLLFGIGNGTAFVPLTGASLAGVRPEDAGAASGLVNVAQQVGGALGLAILVSVFGAADHGHDVVSRFVAGADAVFWVATGLLLLSAVLVSTIRPARATPTAA